ncbi:RNA-binding S4 domain-containing protein [Yunchengibacter salinarum]|uniref:RNA-binding S4 domain-containing protein n=1 Tax=Yunchengibacter salinarum TaxID=3133399 RepID=UPI0035B5B514
MDAPEAETIRIDKWLWHARFFKTRTLAASVVKGRRVRLNGVVVAKPARTVQQGDVLTFVKADRVRVVRITGPGTRRGPASEAATLYDDLSPPEETPDRGRAAADGVRAPGAGRPTKQDRRALAAWKHSGDGGL